jgi:hypothetical protein
MDVRNVFVFMMVLAFAFNMMVLNFASSLFLTFFTQAILGLYIFSAIFCRVSLAIIF